MLIIFDNIHSLLNLLAFGQITTPYSRFDQTSVKSRSVYLIHF